MSKIKQILAIAMVVMMGVVFMPVVPGVNGVASADATTCTVSWTITNVQKNGSNVNGVCYLLVNENISRDSVLALAGKGAKAMTDALGATSARAFQWTVSDGTGNLVNKDPNQPSLADLGLNEDTMYYFYMICFDTATITDQSNFYVTVLKSYKVGKGAANTSIYFGSQKTQSGETGAWKAVFTPNLTGKAVDKDGAEFAGGGVTFKVGGSEVTRAEKNDTVNVSATEVAGYTATLTGTYGTDGTGNDLTINNDGSFTMPEGKVIVTAKYEKVVAQIGDKNYSTVQAAVDAATEGQTVKLLSDVDLTATINIAADKNFTLDLNGKTLDAKNLTKPTAKGQKASVIYINSGATLTLNDSSEGDPGKITGGKGVYNSEYTYGGGVYNAGTLNIYKVSSTKNTAYKGAGVYNDGKSILNMYSGEISYNETSGGGAGAAVNNSGTFTLEGGNIKKNTANNGNAGGVSTTGTFTMNGGTISENKSTNQVEEILYDTCAVFVVNVKGNFVMNNGSITKNIGGGVLYSSGNIEVSGASKITDNTSAKDGSAYNVKINKGNTITIGAAGLKEGASIGVTTASAPTATAGVAFTSNGTADDAKYFTSDSPAFKVKYVPATTGESAVAAHLELVNYCDLGQIASDTTSITLEKADMTKEQAIAIAKVQKPKSGLDESKYTYIAYAKADDFNTSSKYEVIKANKSNDWAAGTAMKLTDMKADIANNDYFVTGTANSHEHSFTYEANTANKTITATCSADGCGLTDKKVTATLVAEDKAYTGEAYAGASITGKDAWDDAGAATLSLKYKGRGDTSYTESETAPTAVGTYTVTMTAKDTDKSVSADFEITKKQLSISTEEGEKTVVEGSKTYDGKTDANVTKKGTLVGVVEGDTVSLDKVTATYEDKNVGTGKKITVKYTITGDAAGNYKAPADNESLTADITKKEISVIGTTVAGKTYDGKTDATVNKGTLKDVIQGDTVNLSATGEFDNKNAGEGKDVTVKYTLSGTDAGNYELVDEIETKSASIMAKDLTVTDTVVKNKAYDGKKDAEFTAKGTIADVVEGDEVTLSATGEFDDKNVGEDKDVYVDYSISGTDAGNYNLTTTRATLKANITARELTVDETTVAGKTYDGNTTADVTAGTLKGVIGSDDVEIDTATGAFKDKNAGKDKKVTVSYTLKGGDKANYAVKDDEKTATIEQKEITVAAGTYKVSKVYDGTTKAGTASGKLSVEGILAADTGVSIKEGEIPAYSAKDVKDDYSIALPISIDGDTNSNYKIKDDAKTVSVPGEITKKTITVTKGITATDRAYEPDNKSVGLVTKDAVLDGKIKDDNLSVDATGEMKTPDAGKDKEVTIIITGLSGTDKGNYELAETGNQSKTTVDIAKATTTVTKEPSASAITYGQDLSDSTLSGGEGSVAGSFAWTEPKTKPDVSDSDKTAYDVTFTPTDGDNYDTATCKVKLIVNKAKVEVPEAVTGLKYNGNEQTGVVLPEGAEFTLTGNTGTDAKADYTATATLTNKDNYEWKLDTPTTDDQEITWEIARRNVTLTSASDTKQYDGTPLTNNKVTAGGDDFADGEGATYNVTGSQTQVGSSANTFTYKLDGETKEDNYEIAKTEGTLTVTPVDVPGSDVKIKEIDGTNAKLETISKADIAKAGETFTIDLSDVEIKGEKKEITQVTLTKETMNNLSESDVKNVEIKLSTGTVVLDKDAVKAVTDQAEGSEVKLTLETGEKAEKTLTEAQKKTISEMNTPSVVYAAFESAGKKISDFRGGKADVLIQYETTRPIKVWFVAEEGDKDKVPSHFDKEKQIATFEADHFSIYVIETTNEAEECFMATGSAKKSTNTIRWNAVEDADGYVVYYAKNGKSLKKVKTTTELKYTKKSLNAKSIYKYKVKAYEVVDGDKQFIESAPVIYIAGSKSKYSNAVKVAATPDGINMEAGDTAKVKAKVTKKSSKKKLYKKSKMYYRSSDKSVATVDSKGKVKAIGEGEAYVYAYAASGAFAKVQVTVE